MRLLLGLCVAAICVSSCNNQPKADGSASTDFAYLIHELNDGLRNVVVEDGFSPPIASRIYAYPNIVAYEIAILGQDSFVSVVGQLKDLNNLPKPESDLGNGKYAALVQAYSDVATHMTYRDHLMEAVRDTLLAGLKPFMEAEQFEAGKAYGSLVAKAIIEWANDDGYNQTRNLPKFTVGTAEYDWKPTPPKYGEAIEPYWGTIKPFVIETDSQFRLSLPYEYSTDTASKYYKLVEEIMGIANEATDERIVIAKFWDCNPTPSIVDGHVMQTNKQNTPPGHWLGITTDAITSHHLNLAESCEIYMKVMVSMADGFKCAWDSKYATNFLRPETFIVKYIDPDFTTKLETPLFPEFPSAHSVISACAEQILTDRFGDQYSFIDSTNVPYGLPVRHFNSFKEAAMEAAISRVYGGIHYKPSCELGYEQGTKVGQWTLTHLRTRK